MAEAGTGAIFRIDSVGDTEDTAKTANEIIEFNGGTAPDTTGRTTGTSFEMTRSVNVHPNPRRALDQIQDGKLSFLEVIITGYFVDHDDTTGPSQLFDWMNEDASNAALPFGRFGLRLDDSFNEKLALIPTATAGYILYHTHVDDAESPRDQASFTIKLYRNGVI